MYQDLFANVWMFCVQQQPTASPYLQGIPAIGGFGPYIASSSPVMTMGVSDGMSQITGVLPQQMLAAQKIPRTDRLEVRPTSPVLCCLPILGSAYQCVICIHEFLITLLYSNLKMFSSAFRMMSLAHFNVHCFAKMKCWG